VVFYTNTLNYEKDTQNMTLTRYQCRAARMLLEWGQDELSQKSGIAKQTILNFEKGRANPSNATLERISNAFDEHGVLFGDHDSVKRKPRSTHRVLRGADGFKEFIYDVYHTVQYGGGDIIATNVNERDFEKWQGRHATDYIGKMSKVKNLNFKILIKEGDNYYTASEYAHYKHVPAKYFTGVPTYVYANKKAEILFEDNDVTVLLTENQRLAEAQRAQFDLMWSALDE